MEKKRTDYSKESTKSKPSGVRFYLEKLAFIQSKEKLTTKQKVVDFLLNTYWWQHKVHVPTHKDVPPIEPQHSGQTFVNALEIIDDVLPRTPKPLNVAQWISKKRELETEEQFSEFLADLEASNLSDKQKAAIKIA